MKDGVLSSRHFFNHSTPEPASRIGATIVSSHNTGILAGELKKALVPPASLDLVTRSVPSPGLASCTPACSLDHKSSPGQLVLLAEAILGQFLRRVEYGRNQACQMLIHAAPAQAILESLVSPAGVLDFLSHCSKRKQQGAAVFGGSSSISCFFCFWLSFCLAGLRKARGGGVGAGWRPKS